MKAIEPSTFNLFIRMTKFLIVLSAYSFLAEREGFEPSIEKIYTAFRVQRTRPTMRPLRV